MSSVLAASLLARVLAGPAEGPDDPPAQDAHGDARERGGERERGAKLEGLRAWVTRPVPSQSARFLDHGIVAVTAAGGTPHRYRLDVRVGLLDNLSLGATAHWLPGQRAPQVWPVAAIAFWRGRKLELGAHYRPVLYPPVDPELRFEPRTHLALASFVLSSGLWSAGIDAGAAHTRAADVDPDETLVFHRRTVFGGGAFARFGTRRWGLSADATAVLAPTPLLIFEVALDLRFGAFEERPPGGWRPW